MPWEYTYINNLKLEAVIVEIKLPPWDSESKPSSITKY